MNSPDWREQPIAREHHRSGFDCGSPELNNYLGRYARQNHESGGAKTFVFTPWDEPSRIAGYYSISPGSIAFARVPSAVTRKLGRYEVPIFRLGRLAVGIDMQGRGVGAALLFAAGRRAIAVAAEIGGVALAIDAKNVDAARWYARFGAIALIDEPLSLILPLATIAEATAATA